MTCSNVDIKMVSYVTYTDCSLISISRYNKIFNLACALQANFLLVEHIVLVISATVLLICLIKFKCTFPVAKQQK